MPTSTAHKQRAVFFDRDGVINDIVDRGDDFFILEKRVRFTAPFSYEEFHMKDGVEAALRAVHDAGFVCILATNQPDIVYQKLPIAEHERIMAEVAALPFDDVFICMHGRDDNCECKKPKPGMLLAAARKHGIDLAASYILGDTDNDTQAGSAAGVKTILIDYPYNQGVISDYRIAHINQLPTLFISSLL